MTIVLALILLPLIILTSCFAVELFVGLSTLRRMHSNPHVSASAVILMPAHDEAALIAHSLSTLKDAAAACGAKILVIADNCSDSTAAEARRVLVDVIERNDPHRRGKGFALDFGRRHLAKAPPDIVVIIDADCRMDERSLARLIAACAGNSRPCQAQYLLDPLPGLPPPVQLSNFAFFVKNVVRQRALQRLAGRVHLLGTGMALPWSSFDREQLATADIVEDLRMGLELAEAGSPPIYIEDAEIWSVPETSSNTLVQRRRWEGGMLSHALQSGPRMLVRAIARGDLKSIWASLDLMVPPLALLIMVDVVAIVLGTIFAWLTGADRWPLLVLLFCLMAAGAGLMAVWARGGSRFVSLSGLARIPLYLAWKLPLYLGLAKRGAPTEWLRTRGGES